MITYAVYTDLGNREVNEDSVRVFEDGGRYCFVLCDGLGGHGLGDVASSIATEHICDCLRDAESLEDFGGRALDSVQEMLLEEQVTRHATSKMKTTAVILAIDEKNAYITYIGDSRAYCFRRNKVKFRTLDHSIPQMLVIAGEIKETAIRHHPDRNIVLRALGVEWEEPMYEALEGVSLRKCQAFLLCSDGFWELIEEREMCELLKKSRTVEEWMDSMAAVVKENGRGVEMDNNSAIAIWC